MPEANQDKLVRISNFMSVQSKTTNAKLLIAEGENGKRQT